VSGRDSESFADLHPGLAGFDEHWEAIRPRLAELQALSERRYARARVLSWCAAIGGFAAATAIGYGSFARPGTLDPELAKILILAAIGAGLVGYMAIWRWAATERDRAGDMVRSAVFEFFGLEHRRQAPPHLGTRFTDLGLVAAHSRSSASDYVSGQIDGVEVEFCEFKATRKSGKRRITVFQGFLFCLHRPTALTGRIVIAKDRGAVMTFLKGLFSSQEPVDTGDETFDRAFNVFTDLPPDRLAGYLGDAFRADMLMLSRASGGGVTAAILDDRFLLAVQDKRDLFEIGGWRVDLTDKRNVLAVAEGMAPLVDIARRFAHIP